MSEHAIVELIRDQDPLMLPASATVMAAARHMHSRHASAVLVIEADGALVGIFTERDAISRVLAQGRDPVTTTLAEVMTDNPDTATPEQSADDMVRGMIAAHCRHLPVVERGKVVALVARGGFRAAD